MKRNDRSGKVSVMTAHSRVCVCECDSVCDTYIIRDGVHSLGDDSLGGAQTLIEKKRKRGGKEAGREGGRKRAKEGG